MPSVGLARARHLDSEKAKPSLDRAHDSIPNQKPRAFQVAELASPRAAQARVLQSLIECDGENYLGRYGPALWPTWRAGRKPLEYPNPSKDAP